MIELHTIDNSACNNYQGKQIIVFIMLMLCSYDKWANGTNFMFQVCLSRLAVKL